MQVLFTSELDNKMFYPADLSIFKSQTPDFAITPLNEIHNQTIIKGKLYRPRWYTIIFIKSGKMSIQVDEHNFTIVDGGVICIPPNSVISLSIQEGTKGCFIGFNASFFSLRFHNHVLANFSIFSRITSSFVYLKENQIEKWHALIDSIIYEVKSQKKGYDVVVRSYLNILLHDLDRINKPEFSIMRINKAEEKLVAFVQLVNDNYLTQRSPKWYADELNISVNYLGRICKRYLLRTPGEVIREEVWKEAQRMLYLTNQSVAEIAYKLGFESASYFSTAFKRDLKCTPEEFREVMPRFF